MQPSKQRGEISRNLIWIVVAVVAVLIGIASYWSAVNYGNATENRLDAILESNENIYAQGTQKVMEIAQVPGMYAADLSAIITKAVQGTYGPNGSQATVQFLRERNISLDPSMYTKIQQVIESFRNQFESAQKDMIEVKRSYKTALGTPWQGFWLARAGYPKVDLKKYDIVTTDKARQTFETKRDSGIQLRPSN